MFGTTGPQSFLGSNNSKSHNHFEVNQWYTTWVCVAFLFCHLIIIKPIGSYNGQECPSTKTRNSKSHSNCSILYRSRAHTTTNLLDKGPVVRSFTDFFVHHTKKSNLVQNKKFCGFQTQGCDYSLVHNFLMAI